MNCTQTRTVVRRTAFGQLPARAIAGRLVVAAVAVWVVCAAGGSRVPRLAWAAGPEPCSREWLAQGSRWAGASPLAQALPALPMVTGRAGHTTRPAALPGPQSVAPPNDELYWAGQGNSLPVMRALDAWETTYGGADVTIAVIGDGVDLQHPDLDAKIWRNRRERRNGVDDDGNGYVDDLVGWDFGQADGDPSPWELLPERAEPVLVGPRGTMLAGIAAAETNNRIGVAAVNWNARVMPLKVLRTYPRPDGSSVVGAYPEDFTRAVCYASNHGARVILFSYTNLEAVDSAAASLERLRVAIDHAYGRGALTVAPAGDCGQAKSWCPDPGQHGTNPPMFPAVFDRVMGVQAFRPGGTLRDTASAGPWVDLAAPGEGYYTTRPWENNEGYYYIRRETAVISDFAAAQVAGVVALMMSVNPEYSLARLEAKLCETTLRDIGKPYNEYGRNDRYGCGQLSAENAVEHMPWKMRVEPGRILDLTNGQPPWPARDFVNPYLNAIRWEIRPDVTWLRTLPVTGRPGGPAMARVQVDGESMPEGMLQSGTVHTETLRACTVGGVVEDCQVIEYGLRLVDRVWRLLLPLTLTGTD
jgi:subtilisin family serine protease